MSLNGVLTDERVLAAEAGVLTLTDGGAGGNATISISANGVTFAKIEQVPTSTILGRVTAGVGNVEELTGTQATTLLDVFTTLLKGLAPASGGGTANYLRADGTWAAPPGTTPAAPPDATYVTLSTNATLTNERTLAGEATVISITDGGAGNPVTVGISANGVTYAKIQDVSATSRFLGRITGGAGDIEELTGTQATTLLDNFTSALDGLAPASGGGTTTYLRADGTWQTPPGSGASIAAGWRFSTSTVASDPGNRTFRMNNATIASVTALYFNDIAIDGWDAGTLLGFLASGNRIYIQQSNDGSRAALFQVTGAATDNGGWWTVPVSVVLSATIYQNNAECGAIFILQSGGGSGSQAAIQFQDEGSNLGAAGTVDTVDFVGAGVTSSRVSNTVTVTIAGGSGSFSLTTVEVDFGSTPRWDALFTITDAGISPTSNIMIGESGKVATGRLAQGDAQWDSIQCAALPGTGDMQVFCSVFPGPVVGKRTLQYTIG
jgi:hypothetical protein